MSKLSIFETLMPNSLNTYKDEKHKQQTNATKAVMNPSSIYILPRFIYKHLNKYNGSILASLQEYLSYEDAALLFAINHKFKYDELSIMTIYNSLPEAFKANIDFLMKTDNLKNSVNDYLDVIANDKEENFYDIINIENNIYIVVDNGFCAKLTDKELKLKFLKDLCNMCFNVMGDGKTTAQPFFKEFVDVL